MLLASLDDINAHLPEHIHITEGLDNLLQISAARTIRGYLSDILMPTTLAAWGEPDNTPEIIREIAGKLIAARWYAKKMAAEVADDTADYAQNLYDEAIGDLMRVRNRTLYITELTDADYITTISDLSEDMFLPNSLSDPPKFTMSLFDG